MKSALDLDFTEYNEWATGYVLLGIGRGEKLQSLIFTILEQALRNNVFGSGKNDKKKKS